MLHINLKRGPGHGGVPFAGSAPAALPALPRGPRQYAIWAGELLLAMLTRRVLSRTLVRTLLERQRQMGVPLPDALESFGIGRVLQVQTLAEYLGVAWVDLRSTDIDLEVSASLPVMTALELKVVPLSKRRHEVTVAMADPRDRLVLAWLEPALGGKIRPLLAHPGDISRALAAIAKIGQSGELTISL